MATRTQGIRLPHKAALIPWAGSEWSLFFCPITQVWFLGEAIAESMLSGTQSVDSYFSFCPTDAATLTRLVRVRAGEKFFL